MFTLKDALEYERQNKIEDWIHLFLNNEGNNIPFSEGLKLEKRYYIGPTQMELDLFKRCCGPEEGLKYVIDEVGFKRNVESIRKRFKEGWAMPPLIINYSNGEFELNDGNHRYEALIKENIKTYHVIIWTTKESDYKQFMNNYIKD